VIGGGIAGVTTALLLQEEGKHVVLLEDGMLGSGETGRTSAHLASALDDRFSRLEQLHGKEGARLAYASHAAAVDQIESLCAKYRITCEFERLEGFLFCPPEDSSEILHEELEAARAIGISGVRLLRRAPLDGFDTGPCLVFPRQGQFHPIRYLRGLAEHFIRLGGRIFERTHFEDLEPGSPPRARTSSGGTVAAGAFVIATNAPVVSRLSIPLRQYAYRTYAIGLEIPRAAITRALYWDTADPYHYVRVQGSGSRQLLIVGGEDHKTGQPDGDRPDQRFGRLESWTRERFPRVGAVQYLWSGQIMEPADALAFIGRYAPMGENVFVATGDSGHGMTHGTIAGMLLRDLIIGRENPWTELYRPGRLTLRAIGEMARENLNVVPEYGKWLTAGETKGTRGIARGEGRILRHGLKKLACYRDAEGRLHTSSAACPHLGALVTWNAVERTWDCPAHGSRFSATGKVVTGPANSDLKKLGRGRRRRAS
jgi:glycine/D-amino acid oxidase-like deaminating enzyme/nitrite reductase/ring-hydroxylating ferredoxin subunit